MVEGGERLAKEKVSVRKRWRRKTGRVGELEASGR